MGVLRHRGDVKEEKPLRADCKRDNSLYVYVHVVNVKIAAVPPVPR